LLAPQFVRVCVGKGMSWSFCGAVLKATRLSAASARPTKIDQECNRRIGVSHDE